MITGELAGGVLYILTSVPQIPATSIFSKAPSSGISGIGNSRSSVVLVPTRTAARTFFHRVAFLRSCARIHHEIEAYGKGDYSCGSPDEARRTKDRWRRRMGFSDRAKLQIAPVWRSFPLGTRSESIS